MRLPNKTIKKIVEKSEFVDKKQLEKAVSAAEELRKSLSDILIFRGLVSEEILGQLVADYFDVSYISLKKKTIPKKVLDLVPETTARIFRVVPFQVKGNKLKLAMEDPRNLEAIEFVKRKTALEVEPCFITSQELNKALGLYKQNIKQEFAQIIEENLKKTKEVDLSNIEEAASNLPVVKILDTLLEYAMAEGASDIHLEREEEETIVRFRIDGLLRDVLTIPKEMHSALVARIKILSGLKIDEHRIPQDGRFKFKKDKNFISLRVSILPSFYGENIVMRLLEESRRPLSLEELGFNGKKLVSF